MDKAYLKEYSKSDGIADLNLIKFRINSLLKNCQKRKVMDMETKQRIIEMCNLVQSTVSKEMTKELKKQKKEGKEFLSDKEIDKIVDDAIADNGRKTSGCLNISDNYVE